MVFCFAVSNNIQESDNVGLSTDSRDEPCLILCHAIEQIMVELREEPELQEFVERAKNDDRSKFICFGDIWPDFIKCQ